MINVKKPRIISNFDKLIVINMAFYLVMLTYCCVSLLPALYEAKPLDDNGKIMLLTFSWPRRINPFMCCLVIVVNKYLASEYK